MHPTIRLVLLISLCAGTLAAQQAPIARREDRVDVYHGVRVPDPYRWMEEMQGAETHEWIRAQDRYARDYAARLGARDGIRRRVAEAARVARPGVPVKRGGRLFYSMLQGASSQATVMVREPDGRTSTLIDDQLKNPQSRLSRFVPSNDGRFIAYGLTRNASRWEGWRVRDVGNRQDLTDTLAGLHAAGSSVVWLPDGSGFLYDRFPAPAPGHELTQRIENERVYLHRVGHRQSDDRLIFDPGDPHIGVVPAFSTDGKYLVLQVGDRGSANNRVLYREWARERAPLLTLIANADAPYTLVGSKGDSFWFYTTQSAERGRVIAVDLSRPDRAHWRDLVPEATETIDTWIGAIAAGQRIFVGYRKDAWLSIKGFDPDGGPAIDVRLPKVGSVWSFVGRAGDADAFYSLSDFTDPGTVYRLDTRSGVSAVFEQPRLVYDPQTFETQQVFYSSKDGTRIPMFLAHRKDIPLNGRNPTLIYGYGAFNWAASPWFQPLVTAWLQVGGIFALPNIRGGGEYGEAWHQAGVVRNKQNAIDDFLAASEWLIANHYTSGRRLVLNGGSAGGPLVGAALVQRPDLFGASIIDYPALDMLRLDQFTGGRGWRSDFGSTEDSADTRALLAYSPYHNLKPGVCYPATLIAPGEKDETTVPMHAYKFAAALQYAQSCDRPVLLRVSWGAGHAAGATQEESIDTWTDELAFLVRVLELDPAQIEGLGVRPD